VRVFPKPRELACVWLVFWHDDATERETQAAEASLFEDLPLPSAEQVQQAQAKEAAKRPMSPRLLSQPLADRDAGF